MMKMWFLLCLVCLAGAEIENKMDLLSRHLQEEMGDVWDMAAVNYSEPVINATYKASVDFDMRAMGPLYNSTHIIIDVIAEKQAYPEGIVKIMDGHIELASPREEWRPLLAHYAGPTAVLLACVLIAAVLPLAGLFWCCCYWCRVGRRRRPFDRKYDTCVKGILAIVLICLLTLYLFGVVCLFATDEQVDNGAEEASESVRTALSDTQEYLNATQAHARWLLVQNYRELEERLLMVLTSSGVVVSTKLGEFSHAVSVTMLNQIVVKLDDVRADLLRVRDLTAGLRARAETLNHGLRKVKNQLLQTLAKCDQPKCEALKNKYKIGQLDTEIHYSQMPDVSELLNNVSGILNSDIKEEVSAGQRVFRDIQTAIRLSVQQHIPQVQTSLTDTGKRLEAIANDITWQAGNASRKLEKQKALAAELDSLFQQHAVHRRYAGLGAAGAALLVCLLMSFGLVYGVCGKRPDVYGASDCCNKGAGATCLFCGIGVIFVLGGCVVLVVAAYFLVGVTSQRFFCDPLTEPRGNRLFADAEKMIDLERLVHGDSPTRDPDFNMTYVLLHCHANKTIYETLQLSRKYDLDEIRASVSREISARVRSLRPAFPAAAPAVLPPAARRKLLRLANTGLSEFDFDRILHALESNLTTLALDGLAGQLNSTAHALPQPAFAAETHALLAAADQLRALQQGTLRPMQQASAELNETAIRLRKEVRFNHTSLRSAIEHLMVETSQAEVFLNKEGPERLQNLTRDYASVIEVRLNEYLERVISAAKGDVGRCGPLSNAFNATRDAACNKILMPTNGYWIALAWCVMLFLPLLVVAQRLARLYQHLDPYPGPLVEAEYLYDAYADRDNVPLANAYKAEKRGGRRARAGEGRAAGGGGGGGGGGEAAPPAPAGAHARRYNDMAPKHWEEGPPRYHGPTEYERPPPYYYPGPTDRQ